ncbi:hypothetical protein PG989_015496 [Apiospora arundinis]
MERANVPGYFDIVNSVFGKPKSPRKLTVFMPGFTMSCLRSLGLLGQAIKRVNDDKFKICKDLGGNDYFKIKAYIRAEVAPFVISTATGPEMLDRDKFLDSFAELAIPKVDEFFQLREKAQEEASMLAATPVAPPPFLQANDPICFFAVDPKQQDWPKNGSVAPRVQFAWNDILLEKTVKEQNESMKKALKNKTFTVYPSANENPVEFWPGLAQIRDRASGINFGDCRHAKVEEPEPEPGSQPSDTSAATSKPEPSTDPSLPAEGTFEDDVYMEEEDDLQNEMEDTVQPDVPPSIDRALSVLVID